MPPWAYSSAVWRGGPPAVQLPADPVRDSGRRQQPVVPPQPAAFLSVRPGDPHLHADTGQPAGGEAGVQLLGERLGREHHGLGQRFRRVEFPGHGQVVSGRAGRERAEVQAAGQPVHGFSRVAEPAGHIAGRQRGEVAKGARPSRFSNPARS